MDGHNAEADGRGIGTSFLPSSKITKEPRRFIEVRTWKCSRLSLGLNYTVFPIADVREDGRIDTPEKQP